MESKETKTLFWLSGTADIKHINVRKQGPDDVKILAVDIKLEFRKADKAICKFFDDSLESFLWRGDTNALIVRNECLAPVQYSNAVSPAAVDIAGMVFFGAEIKKFSITPNDGGIVTLCCSVSIYPTADQVAKLAKLVQDETRISLEGPPDIFGE